MEYDDCWGCKHPAVMHPLEDDDTLPLVLRAAPCIVKLRPDLGFHLTCDCDDYDGMTHPERPSLAEAWVYQTEDGGVGAV
jgi:hypothetical protein